MACGIDVVHDLIPLFLQFSIAQNESIKSNPKRSNGEISQGLSLNSAPVAHHQDLHTNATDCHPEWSLFTQNDTI